MKHLVFWGEAFLKSSSVLTILRMPLVFEQQSRCYMVNTSHQCSYDNSAISSVSKLKTIRRFSSFPLLSFFFLSLFFLICFVFPVCVKESLFYLLDTKVNLNCLLISERERGRERRGRESRRERGRQKRVAEKSSRKGVGVVGWYGGAG